MSYQCDLLFIFIFIFIMINCVMSWIKTRFTFYLYITMSYYFWTRTWMENVNNSQTAKFRLALLIKAVLIKKACIAKVGKFFLNFFSFQRRGSTDIIHAKFISDCMCYSANKSILVIIHSVAFFTQWKSQFIW